MARTKIIENQSDNSNSQTPKSIVQIDTGITGVALGTFTPTLLIFGIGGYSYINLQPLINTTTNKDIVITDNSQGLILTSPNGTQFRIFVKDTGILYTVPV
jgi:hypothetical protein